MTWIELYLAFGAPAALLLVCLLMSWLLDRRH
jgi:hypothetical protein